MASGAPAINKHMSSYCAAVEMHRRSAFSGMQVARYSEGSVLLNFEQTWLTNAMAICISKVQKSKNQFIDFLGYNSGANVSAVAA